MRTSLTGYERLKGRFNRSLGAGTAAHAIARHVQSLPKEKWVEPFLGRGDVFRAVKPQGQAILGDLDCDRVKLARAKTCDESPGSCALLQQATVSCGSDWKTSLKHDGPGTTFFLDPPWEGVEAAQSTPYRESRPIPAREIFDKTRNLQGAVAVYYRDKPEVREVLCREPFRCHTIPRWVFNHKFTTLLAVKPAGRAG